MNKRFRSGRLMLTRDGIIKKLYLEGGGGTRVCNRDNNNMTFDDVHYRLRNLFNLNNKKYKTSLYDFKLEKINVKQFNTFGEYINKHGLNGNSTVVYLCTHEGDDDDKSRKISLKQKSSLIEYTHVVTSEVCVSQQQINSQSSFEYSFRNSTNDLIKNVRELINQNGFDEILIQLFEYVCVIHGSVTAIIDPIQQQNQQSINRFEATLYLNSLNNIYDICESIKILLHLNKNSFDHIQVFSTIRTSFLQFYNNVQFLRNECLDKIGNNTTPLASSSMTRSDIESTSISHIQSSTEDHHEITTKNLSQVSLTSTHQLCSSSEEFKPSTSSQELSNEETNEKYFIFRSVLSKFHSLLRLLKPKHLSSLHELITLAIRDIKSVRSNINLFDEPSICDTKRIILSIRDQFNTIVDKQDIRQSKSNSDRILYEACSKTLKAIRYLLASLYQYQMKIYNNNQQN